MSDDRMDEELERVIEAIAESYLTTPIGEIRAEIAEEGQDPDEVAQHTRDLLQGAVRTHGRGLLERAKEEHLRAVTALQTKEHTLPETPEERRQLLQAVIAARPILQKPLTLQHRELNELTDEDVASTLRQLAELGVLQEIQGENDEE